MNQSECANIDGFGYWHMNGQIHREDGPVYESADGNGAWALNGVFINPKEAINDPELKLKYPKLIESMIIYLVHNS